MSRAIITIVLEVEGDAADIVNVQESLDAALGTHCAEHDVQAHNITVRSRNMTTERQEDANAIRK
ncbi:MAG TPA: hypothetical protein VKQ11_00605 [Candidatus Sulfotelmatobacter sp.]|nr:hypothetical protein [Candidatus Sulfotelmatobacter sp.]